MLSEAFFAENALDLIDDLKAVRQQLFITETPELTAIIGKLGLQAAANTSANFNFQSLFAGSFGVAASVLGVAEPEVSAALWVGSEIASMIPAGSPTASSSFQTTYTGLQDQFATMVSETEKSIAVQSQLIRQDEGLLELVGQLRSRGTWAIDSIGIGSAANQAFAAWVYQALLPTVYDRYHITSCFNGFLTDFPTSSSCNAPAWGPGVLGTSGQGLAQSFTTIAQPYDATNGVPCQSDIGPCIFSFPPSDLMQQVWGRVEPECSYQPGKADTAWTFGSCSAGVDAITSIGKNTWGFPERSGSPDTMVAERNRDRRCGSRRHRRRRTDATADADQARPAAARAPPRRARPRAIARRHHNPACDPAGGRDRHAAPGAVRGAGPRRADATERRSRGAAAQAQTRARCCRAFHRGHDEPPERADRAAPRRPAGTHAADAGDRRRGLPRAAGLPRLAGVDRDRYPAAAFGVAACDQRRARPPSHRARAPPALPA